MDGSMAAGFSEDDTLYMAAAPAFRKPCRVPESPLRAENRDMFAGSTTAKIGAGGGQTVLRAAVQKAYRSEVGRTDKCFAIANSEAIPPRALGSAAAKREITDVQSIQHVRKWCELEHRCRFGMGPCGLILRGATLSALGAAAGSRGAERADSAAIRAR